MAECVPHVGFGKAGTSALQATPAELVRPVGALLRMAAGARR